LIRIEKVRSKNMPFIEHIAIWVKDLEKMKQFYTGYFSAVAGAKYYNPVKQFSSYFLSFAGGCRLEIMHMPSVDENKNSIEPQSTGLIHFAISVGSEERVHSLTEELRGNGYTIAGGPRRTGDGYYESVVLDPENNRIEITV
jgi:lactoylglutathione lyase